MHGRWSLGTELVFTVDAATDYVVNALRTSVARAAKTRFMIHQEELSWIEFWPRVHEVEGFADGALFTIGASWRSLDQGEFACDKTPPR